MSERKKTRTLVGAEAREALLKGVSEVAIPVAATMGAKGRNAVYRDFGRPVVTNDGVSIARQIYPEGIFERMGADMIIQASEKTNEEAGDGTTTSIVLADAMIRKGVEIVNGGKVNPVSLRKDLEAIKDKVVAGLQEISVDVKGDKDLLEVAKISVEDEKIAQVVTDAVKKAGEYGRVIVEEGVGYTLEKEEKEGFFWDKGYVSPYMVNNERGEAVLENPQVIVTDRAMSGNKDLVGLLTQLHQGGAKNILVIADNIEGELLQTMIVNKMKNILNTVVVKRPPTLDELEDIAALTGATAVTKDKGIKDIQTFHVGQAKRVVVKKDSTVLIGNSNMTLEKRIEDMKAEIEDEKNKDIEAIKSRLGKLANGIVILRVGAKTEAERKYLKLKIDDAVGACRAAMEEGIVPGGGVALLKVLKSLKVESEPMSDAESIMFEALQAPYIQILKNAGIEPDGKYYNVLTGAVVKDMVKEGIVDPTKVTRCAIENAVSLAGVFLTLETVVVEVEEFSPQSQDSVPTKS